MMPWCNLICSSFVARFCPSMFLYLMTVIPCDWIAKNDVLECVSATGDACRKAVNGSGIQDVSTDSV